QHFTDATEALTKIGEYFVNQEIVSLPYVKSLLRRHQKTGVYIGNFVALPHGEEEAQQWIKEEGLFLIQVPDGVDFGTKEQPKIATILFVVVLKEQQLAVLQEIAFFCSDMQNVRALSDAESVEEIQQILLAEE
ncbi:MAG TPA: PTS mannitol transporter subunit IIA, partial [Enterococcus sp.]|nr:PTS mannitol transporter subunit IIA [Enterococcus sp.]